MVLDGVVCLSKLRFFFPESESVCVKSGAYREVCEYYGQHVSWPALGYFA